MIRFELARLLFYRDIKRCPFAIGTHGCSEWNRVEDRRQLLIELERYLVILDYLRNIR